jgi:two-component system response regulator AtoC
LKNCVAGERAPAGAVLTIMPVRRLLVADDDPDIRWVISSILADRFGDIQQASDGRELLWQLLRAAYIEDHSLFVIADVRMPIYDGIQVIDAYRFLGFELPMVLMSAYADDAVREQAAKLGVLLLVKPFTSAQLRAAVAEL